MTTPTIGWVAELVRPRPAPIPWPRVLRTGIAVGAPVSVGMAIGQLGPGLLCSIGALAASLADKEGPYPSRVYRIGVIALSGVAGFVLGELAFGHPLFTPAAVLIAGLVSGVVSVLGNVASVASLQFLIYTIVGSGVQFGNGPGWLPPLFYLLGATWALVLALSGGIGRATAPERAAVADVYRSLAVLMEMSGGTGVEAARQELTSAMNLAYDTVIARRASLGGRDPRVRRLAALLNAATPVVEATLALVRDRVRVPLHVSGEVRSIAVALRDDDTSSRRRHAPIVDAPGKADLKSVDGPPRELDALESALRSVSALLFGGAKIDDRPPRALGVGERLRNLGDALADAVGSGVTTWQPVVRLVLCLAVAEVLGRFVPTERPYWIALTVAVTLKPDFGSVFARAVQRGVGTMVGVLIGTGLLVLLAPGPAILAAIAVFAAMLPVTQRRNYGLFATFLTPVIVLLLDLAHGGEEQLVLSRLFDTALGCAIVLAVGYLPWPDTWRSRSRFAERVADVCDEVLEYLRVALVGPDASRHSLRRRTYRGLSDLRTVLQQALSEPPPVSRQAAEWWPVIVALERVTDAITAVVVRERSGEAQASADAIELVIAYMEEFSRAIRRHARPRELPLPEGDALDDLAGELRTAASVVAGPSVTA